jgi:polyphenol oxidase
MTTEILLGVRRSSRLLIYAINGLCRCLCKQPCAASPFLGVKHISLYRQIKVSAKYGFTFVWALTTILTGSIHPRHESLQESEINALNRIVSEKLAYYEFEMWPQLRHGVFTRHGGVSPEPWASLNMGGTVGDDAAVVRHNHDLMYEALKLNKTRVCTTWQVHGADTIIADQPVRGRRWLALADGIVTDRLDTPLVMRYADCTPLLFLDPVRGVIGIAHAGWRGTVSGAGASVARTMMQAYGCKPADIQAGIGPSIGPERYQVGEEVVEAAQTYFGTTEGIIRRDARDGTAYFDLWEANRFDLQRMGIEQIEVAAICTAQNTDEFYSHRAEHGRTGRFGAVISL